MSLVSRLTFPALLGGLIALVASGVFFPQANAAAHPMDTIAQVTGVPEGRVLNIFGAPASDAEKIGAFAARSWVWVEGCDADGWCLVERAGTRGWVSASHLTPHWD